jgi:hypothetical protein
MLGGAGGRKERPCYVGEVRPERFREVRRALDVLEETPSIADTLEIKLYARSRRPCLLQPVTRLGGVGAVSPGVSTRDRRAYGSSGTGRRWSLAERSGGGAGASATVRVLTVGPGAGGQHGVECVEVRLGCDCSRPLQRLVSRAGSRRCPR